MRPTLNETFMEIAKYWARRSTCDRLAAGAVIARGGAIITSGYNGSPRQQPHCSGLDGVGHYLVDGHCIRTLHAEWNAIIQAAREGASLIGGTLYSTHQPCYHCAKMIVQTGITDVRFLEPYHNNIGNDSVEELLLSAGIRVNGVHRGGICP